MSMVTNRLEIAIQLKVVVNMRILDTKYFRSTPGHTLEICCYALTVH